VSSTADTRTWRPTLAWVLPFLPDLPVIVFDVRWYLAVVEKRAPAG
jgi:hypothetical protein